MKVLALYVSLLGAFSSVWKGRTVTLPEVSSTTDRGVEILPPLEKGERQTRGLIRSLERQVKRLTKSISLGDALPKFLSGRALLAPYSEKEAIEEGAKRSVWVFACVREKTRAVASVEWNVYRRLPDGRRELLPDHPAAVLLRKPNPFWSRSDFFERIVWHLELLGNAYIAKVRSVLNGEIIELWTHQPDCVSPIPSGDGDFLAGYEMRAGNKKHKVERSEIVHLRYADPANPYIGLSPLQVARRTVETDSEAVAWNHSAMQNRCVADGAFVSKSTLTPESYAFMRKIVREQHQGTDNARTPWVLGSDMKFEAMSLSPIDMDFLNGRLAARHEICAVFGVPPVLVGDLQNSTYSNYSTARDVFWQDRIVPLLESIGDALTRGILAEFGDDLVFDFDRSKIDALNRVDASKIAATERLHKLGVPLGELNRRFNLGLDENALPLGDSAFVGGTLYLDGLPYSNAAAAPQARTPEDSADIEAMKALLSQSAVLAKRIANGETPDPEDLRKLLALSEDIDDVNARLDDPFDALIRLAGEE